MGNVSTTKMSSKGQVVIPEEIRLRLGLEAGVQFVVIGEKDVVILKAISPPSMKDFDKMVSKARSQARKSGMKKSDVKQALSDTRAKR